MSARRPKNVFTIALSCCAACTAMPAMAEEGGPWDWIVAPYAWAATISTDVHTGRPPDGGISTDTAFDDVLDKLDGAFQVHAEGQGDHFGLFADFTYLGLADDHDYPRFGSESDLDTRLFEMAAVWSPGGERYRGWEVFAGLRYFDTDLTVRFDPVNPAFGSTTFETSTSYSDFMLGGRYSWAWDRWSLTLRGDGSFGDTEGTWNVSAIAQYRVKYGAWAFGYRHLDAELEAAGFDTELTLTGPVVGFGFTF